MKAYEHLVKIDSEGKIELPEELKAILPVDQLVRVLIFIEEPTDSKTLADWSDRVRQEFIPPYQESDSICDDF